jgi:hypothetical protein
MDAELPPNGTTTDAADADRLATDLLGPHSAFVTAISDLVSSPEVSGGRAIALTGKWGSGKSFIVEEVRRKLHDPEGEKTLDVGVFVFDAWAHEGEALGRAFLWSFLGFLRERGWATVAHVDSEQRKLTRRGTTATAMQWAEVTGWSAAYRALLGILTLGAVVLGLLDKIGLATTLIVAGLLIAASALVPLGLVWLAFGPRSRGSGRGSQAGAELAGKPRTRTAVESYEELSPTTFEFQETFATLIGQALGQGDRRIVVVLENIDRLDPEDTRAIWSTLRTFYQPEAWSRASGARGWFNRYWLLVPFSVESFAPDPGQSDQAAFYGYLEKLFDYSFRVPPPFFSDWRLFLEQAVVARKAELPSVNHAAAEILKVYSLTRPHGVSMANVGKLYPTPRSLERYVGDLASIHRLHPRLLDNDVHDLVAKAIYAATHRDDDFHDSLYGNGYARYGHHYGFDVQGAMVALDFTVSSGGAGEFGLRGAIGEALGNADIQALRACAAHASFDVHLRAELLRQSVADMASQHVHMVPRAAFTMAGAGVESEHAWALLVDAVVRGTRWYVWDPFVRDGLIHILERPEARANEQYVDILLEDLAASWRPDAPTAPHDEFIGVLGEVLTWRDEHAVDDVPGVAVRVCDDPAAYVAIMQSADVDPDLAKYLLPRCEPADLMPYLSEQSSSIDWAILAPRLAVVGGGWQWDQAADPVFAAMTKAIHERRRARGDELSWFDQVDELRVVLIETTAEEDETSPAEPVAPDPVSRLDLLTWDLADQSERDAGVIMLYLLEFLPESPAADIVAEGGPTDGWVRYTAFTNALGSASLDEQQKRMLTVMVELAHRYARIPSLTRRAHDLRRVEHEFGLFLPHFVEAYDGEHLDMAGLNRLVDARHTASGARDVYRGALERAEKFGSKS